ncbi:hypothetical protein [Brevundimonas sp. FT23028]|uniref:hypothetical protein n=1 Tax=Brevundimonas sp. FT23028 TaxID=3393748 RepID=UPI003B588B8C
MKTGPFGLKTIFAIPAGVAVLSLTGLVGALLGDGVWDWIGWIGLGACVAVTIWALIARRQS